MKELCVYLTLPDGGQHLAGRLMFEDADAQGRFASRFEYDSGWLEHAAVFPLDPRNLPLGPGGFETNQLESPLGVFRDALPDHWGRRLMVLERGLARREQWEPGLLEFMGARGMGALAFFRPDSRAESQADVSADILQVDDLLEGADRIARGLGVDRSVRLLIAAGSSPGGERPKALVRDRERHWIAKFPAPDDRFDVVGLEAAAVACARHAGLVVPDTRLMPLGAGRKVLLVERFDLCGDRGRYHMLSFASLLREGRGVYVHGYMDLFDVLVRYADANPRREAERLFRQMAFNAAIGNTDEHLKNWLLLHTDEGYAQSPAFDLLPDVGEKREHVLVFGASTQPPDRTTLLGVADRYGVVDVAAILDEVVEAASRFASEARQANVPEQQIRHFARDIDERIRAMRA